MIFALADYWRYINRTGRYARSFKASIMGAAFDGGLPDKVFHVIRSGDILFVQTFDHPLSWLVMYSTSSEISHVAFYLGNGEIGHATLAGTVIEPVEHLYDTSTRILPFVWPMPEETRPKIAETLRREFVGRPYGYAAVILKALRILSARDWPYFRWKFFLDACFTLLFLDLPFLVLFERPVFLWIVPGYLTLIAINAMQWRFRPLPLNEWTGKPCDLLRHLQNNGGSAILDAKTVAESR